MPSMQLVRDRAVDVVRKLLVPGVANLVLALRAGLGAPGPQLPVLLVDCVAGGEWHQRRFGRTLAITVELASPMLTVGTVTVGPHA